MQAPYLQLEVAMQAVRSHVLGARALDLVSHIVRAWLQLRLTSTRSDKPFHSETPSSVPHQCSSSDCLYPRFPMLVIA
jgi:hypothetical protein